ncbi:quinone oxidoreductase [Bisporella sp. PMI_857]|nr:quinone oxidoreductase [Bisporella sp. PMI_857]
MGKDFSGTVVSVGQDVKRFTEGDDVYGLLFEVVYFSRTFSEFIHLDPSKTPVVKKPAILTHEAAASIPLVGLTAYSCLGWLPLSTSNQLKVVIRGASGGTGSWITQIAKIAYGCHVTAICSAKNADYVKELGADEVIDYTSQDVVKSLLSNQASTGKYDLIVDCVGGTDFFESNAYVQLLNPKGGYVTIVGDRNDVKKFGGPITYLTNPAQVIRYIKGWIWGPRYACVSLSTDPKFLTQISNLAERGQIHVEIQEVIPSALSSSPDSWKHAVSLIESARIRGKVVLSIS